MKLPLIKVFSRLTLFSRGVTRSKCSQISHYTQEFGSREKGENLMVVVEGSPGIGKTTVCLKLTYDWAKGTMSSTFPVSEFVFLLKCTDMDRVKVDAVIQQLLPEGIKKSTDREAFLNFIESLNNQSLQKNQGIMWITFLTGKCFRFAMCRPQP